MKQQLLATILCIYSQFKSARCIHNWLSLVISHNIYTALSWQSCDPIPQPQFNRPSAGGSHRERANALPTRATMTAAGISFGAINETYIHLRSCLSPMLCATSAHINANAFIKHAARLQYPSRASVFSPRLFRRDYLIFLSAPAYICFSIGLIKIFRYIYQRALRAVYVHQSARECISMRLKYISMSRARQYARAHLIHRVYSAGTRAKKTSRDTTACAVLSESRAGAHWATNQNASNLALSCRQARTWVFALGARSVVRPPRTKPKHYCMLNCAKPAAHIWMLIRYYTDL